MNEYKQGTLRILYLVAAFLLLAAFVMATLSCKKSMSNSTGGIVQDTDVNTTVNGDMAFEVGESRFYLFYRIRLIS